MTTLETLVIEQERELREKFREMSKVDVNKDLSTYIAKAEALRYLLDAHINYLKGLERFG